jgi:hypothetical protein
VAFLCFLLLCLVVLVLVAGAVVPVSAAIGAADFGISAAIEAAAKPKVNKAVVIRVAVFFMRSPNGWLRLQALRRIRRIRDLQPR